VKPRTPPRRRSFAPFSPESSATSLRHTGLLRKPKVWTSSLLSLVHPTLPSSPCTKPRFPRFRKLTLPRPVHPLFLPVFFVEHVFVQDFFSLLPIFRFPLFFADPFKRGYGGGSLNVTSFWGCDSFSSLAFDFRRSLLPGNVGRFWRRSLG